MTLSGLDVVARGADFESLAPAYELRAWQWAFLHDLDGTTQLRDVAHSGGVDLELALNFVAQCQTRGLVHVVEMTLDEFRRVNGYAPSQIAEPSSEPDAAHDALGAYETTVPAWMMEHHEEPGAPEAWQPDAHVAQVEHEDLTDAWQPDTYAADPPAAVHEWQPDDHQPEAQAQADDTAAARPVMLEFGAEPEYDATAAVAGLMSLEPTEARTPVSLSFGNDLAVPYEDYVEPVAHTERAAAPSEPHGGQADWSHYTEDASTERGEPIYSQYAYEPMSLVTTVDEPVHSHEAPALDPTNGVSIHLYADNGHDDHDPFVASEPPSVAREQGSISFTFTPETVAPDDVAPAHQTAWDDHFSSEPAPQAKPAPEPTMPRVPSEPQRDEAPNASNGKGDLVGNLIARALTFRIK